MFIEKKLYDQIKDFNPVNTNSAKEEIIRQNIIMSIFLRHYNIAIEESKVLQFIKNIKEKKKEVIKDAQFYYDKAMELTNDDIINLYTKNDFYGVDYEIKRMSLISDNLPKTVVQLLNKRIYEVENLPSPSRAILQAYDSSIKAHAKDEGIIVQEQPTLAKYNPSVDQVVNKYREQFLKKQAELNAEINTEDNHFANPTPEPFPDGFNALRKKTSELILKEAVKDDGSEPQIEDDINGFIEQALAVKKEYSIPHVPDYSYIQSGGTTIKLPNDYLYQNDITSEKSV